MLTSVGPGSKGVLVWLLHAPTHLSHPELFGMLGSVLCLNKAECKLLHTRQLQIKEAQQVILAYRTACVECTLSLTCTSSAANSEATLLSPGS